MKNTVLLDCDGVLADFHKHTLDFLGHRFGIQHDVAKFPTWDLFATVDRKYQAETEAHWASPGWCATIPVYPGAVEGVAMLREVAEVYFVTAQMTHSPHWMWERVQWLKQNFGADDRHVVFTLSKHLVVGDVLVDDKPANVASWAAAHPHKHALLWNQPTNVLATGFRRCDAWEDVVDLLSP